MEKRVLLAALLSLGFLFLWQYFMYNPKTTNIKDEEPNRNTILSKKEESQDISLQTFTPFVVETKYLKIVFNKDTAAIREIYIKEEHKQDFILLCKEDKDVFMPNLNLSGNYEVFYSKKENETIVNFELKKEKLQCIYKINDEMPYFVTQEVYSSNPQKLQIIFNGFVRSDENMIEPNVVHICKLQETEKKEMSFVEKINQGKFYKDDKIKWIALSSRYFMVAIIQDEKNLLADTINISKLDKNKKSVSITTEPVSKYTLRLFMGPKKISLLKQVKEKLIYTVEWGTFAPLSKLFYNILTYLYRIFKNYGLAIIGLTIIIQIFTLPLTYNSIKATFKMRQLQPQIQLLQKVYKDDPKRLNMEIMNLYREKKVNPFGGCLPLLLQIPIFWALFTMLRNTYDLRGAGFILWIKDLSQPDRLIIPGLNLGIPVLVVLMGVSMLIQQIVSGTFSDPQQRTMGIIMPIIFTFLFFNFPSGLVLYWFVNNLFSIGVQLLITYSNKK